MTKNALVNSLERSPVIAAVRDDGWKKAIDSPAEVVFYLKANLLTVKDRVAEAVKMGKSVFVHIDLADGIGKDKTGIEFLQTCGAVSYTHLPFRAEGAFQADFPSQPDGKRRGACHCFEAGAFLCQ